MDNIQERTTEKKRIVNSNSEYFERLDRLYPNRHKTIHKTCCKNCPSTKGGDTESDDIKEHCSKEYIAKEYLFVCAWRNSKLCKGFCDFVEIDQQFLNQLSHESLPEPEYNIIDLDMKLQTLKTTGSFLDVLEENYQAAKQDKYNLTSTERATRKKVLQTYEDLIAIYKSYASQQSLQQETKPDIINLAKSCLFLGRRAYSNVTSDEDCWKDFMSNPENVELLNKALQSK